jgi:lysyl-tRNA synthetase class 2
MDLNEQLFAAIAKAITGSTVVKFGEVELDFGKMTRLSMREAIGKYWPQGAGPAPTPAELALPDGPEKAMKLWQEFTFQDEPYKDKSDLSHGLLTEMLFQLIAEPQLIQPTILYDFPTEVSPLSKQKPDDPSLTERFEIYVAGMEIANGFSELNDPAEQERRFLAQVAQGGDEAPKVVDVDYVRALAHGMPPTAGEGIGIDRLTMLLTDSASIRDVILFPLLRPEAKQDSASEGDGA